MAKRNYCTGAPDRIFGIDLRPFCKIHDEHYGHHDVSRKEADIQLRENIKAQGGLKMWLVAWIYYISVRLFGWIFY